MSEPDDPAPHDAARRLRQHLDSLRAAGIEWLPAGGPPPVPKAAAESVHRPSGLFDEPLGEAPAQGGGAPPPEERRRELAVLAGRVAGCTRCAELARTRTQTVFGVGSVDPPVCFVGEAPGANEDAKGEPFVGEAGQLLNRIIAACGMRREEVYICNIIKCRPPGNRLPLPDEAGNCREYLERQIELVRPKFLCALGACAA